ncbi:hypothetical protein RJT34_29772 [Clitoria ternatea]|uniref:C2H2-type domain-containing protein n=1 Tax=Clitoria ternatea TaxID=43366 RepID=A0AAN9I221_CLITE
MSKVHRDKTVFEILFFSSSLSSLSLFSIPSSSQMEVPMEFWGVEVKAGQSVKVDPMEPSGGYIHLSQVSLGEVKKDKIEPVVLYVKVDEQKLVLGTLIKDEIPQISLDLVLDSESELSHNSKAVSVYFCGYKVLTDDDNESEFETKTGDVKVAKTSKSVPASTKQGNTFDSKKDEKTVEPKKDEEDDSDDDESDDDDLLGDMDADEDSDDEENDSDEDDEETPVKKVDVNKKRRSESASKTPLSNKKVKNALTPEKSDGKKIVHQATPHPIKKGGKTPNSVGKGSGGQLSCNTCSKSFTSESGLLQHKKAKHGGQ